MICVWSMKRFCQKVHLLSVQHLDLINQEFDFNQKRDKYSFPKPPSIHRSTTWGIFCERVQQEKPPARVQGWRSWTLWQEENNIYLPSRVMKICAVALCSSSSAIIWCSNFLFPSPTNEAWRCMTDWTLRASHGELGQTFLIALLPRQRSSPPNFALMSLRYARAANQRWATQGPMQQLVWTCLDPGLNTACPSSSRLTTP